MKTILIIEDNKDVRDNTAELLKMSDYKVLTAANGKEGVELANKEKPDLILCDIMMPELDGYGVLHLLSKNAETASIPFIFLTARTERSDFRKGMELGADDYLTKPFDEMELFRAIESRLKKKEQFEKKYSRDLSGVNAFLEDLKQEFEDLKALARAGTVTHHKKKSLVYAEGNTPRVLYFISKGKIKTFRTNEIGKEFITGLYKEGEFFGYMSLITGEAYSDSAEALEDCELLTITKADFQKLIFGKPEVSAQFIRFLTDNLQEREEQLLKIAYNSVRKRVAEGLLTVYQRYKRDEDKVFSINLPREDLANLSGTATESTIRTLSEFKSEGFIDIQGSVITILKPDALQKLKN